MSEAKSADVPSVTLNTGATVPAVGLGTWRAEPGVVAKAVEAAIVAGYRHIDAAWVYQNEKEVGDGIKAGLAAAGIERKDLWVTSKLWNTEHRPDRVRPACERTIADLGVGYLDMYLIHWPVAFEKEGDTIAPKDEAGETRFDMGVSMHETWAAMEALAEAGLAKSIGVSNCTLQMVHELCTKATIRPCVNQVEIHPYNAQPHLVAYCKKLGIAVTAYSPFGSGRTTESGTTVLQDPVVGGIATRIGKTPAQVILRWHLQRGLIVIPKSVSPERIAANIELAGFELSEEDMAAVSGLDQRHRFCGNPAYPFWGPYMFA